MIGAGDAIAAKRHHVSLTFAAQSEIQPDQVTVMSGRLINRSNRHRIAGARIRFYFYSQSR